MPIPKYKKPRLPLSDKENDQSKLKICYKIAVEFDFYYRIFCGDNAVVMHNEKCNEDTQNESAIVQVIISAYNKQ
jgi:hypothetical protein